MEREKLVEIKKGQTGHGLLIEHDGFISLNEETRKMNEAIGEDGEQHIPNPFVVDVVFQKYGIKNANGRIYPEHTLKREVEKYMKKISDKNAIGECYTNEAKILCKDGWKSIVNVKEGEEIYTLNTETKEIEIQSITYKTEQKWSNKLIRLKSDNINELVTPNHGFPLFKDDKFVVFLTASELQSVYDEDLYIPGKFNGISDKDIYIKDIKFSDEDFDGFVYCVEVNNHVWYVEENGFTHWTKNCNHPPESVIDLSRVAINIVELHWEQNTLIGKMELLISPGFRKFGIISCCADEVANLLMHGIKIGVSSRGLGTVTQQGGVLIVGDDFELVCWDVVSDPSTPGAWISTEGKEELDRYVESKDNSDKQILTEKIEKINNILADL